MMFAIFGLIDFSTTHWRRLKRVTKTIVLQYTIQKYFYMHVIYHFLKTNYHKIH